MSKTCDGTNCLNCQLPECDITDKREYLRQWRKNNPEKYARAKERTNILNRKRYLDRKAQGICVNCGKRKADQGNRTYDP